MVSRQAILGFSLLEMLLVLALMAALAGLAVPHWLAQQYPAKRQLAWLQLQQILLQQVELQMQSGDYVVDNIQLPAMSTQLGYDFQAQLREDGLWLQALVRPLGPQGGDRACWQLWLHESGRRQAFDAHGKQTFTCE